MPALLTTFVPIEDAVKALERRTPVASALKSAGWGEMARGFRWILPFDTVCEADFAAPATPA
jgi:hypothetical protein